MCIGLQIVSLVTSTVWASVGSKLTEMLTSNSVFQGCVVAEAFVQGRVNRSGEKCVCSSPTVKKTLSSFLSFPAVQIQGGYRMLVICKFVIVLVVRL